MLTWMESSGVGTNLGDGTRKFMAQDHRERHPCVWVGLTVLGRKDWTSQKFVDINTTDSTVCDFDAELVWTAFPVHVR